MIRTAQKAKGTSMKTIGWKPKTNKEHWAVRNEYENDQVDVSYERV